jgi:hypothetical protein
MVVVRISGEVSLRPQCAGPTVGGSVERTTVRARYTADTERRARREGALVCVALAWREIDALDMVWSDNRVPAFQGKPVEIRH